MLQPVLPKYFGSSSPSPLTYPAYRSAIYTWLSKGHFGSLLAVSL